jgi:hypothetical protein
MSDSVGFGSLTWLIIIALALAGVAFALYRWRVRPSGSAPEGEDFLEEAEREGRLEVLESTPVDAQRRLVLVRCDNVEHLIMVGGPADLVVESDVRKSRTAAKGPTRPATETGRALAVAQERPAPERAEPPAARRSEPASAAPEAQARLDARPAEQRPLPQIAPEGRAPQPAATERKVEELKGSDPKPAEPRPEAPPRFSAPSRPTLTAVPGAAIQPPGSRKDQAGAAASAARDGRIGEAAPRPQAAEVSAGGRREPQFAGNKRAPAVQPAPANANRSDERGRAQPAVTRDGPPAERRQNGSGVEHAGAGRTASLPPAEVPWHESDSVEDEIGRALATEANGSQGGGADNGAPAQPPAVSAGKSDPATTLGDLAERLEEALAREVQSANKGRSRLDPNVDTFSFDRDAAERPASEQRQGSAQAERREPPKVIAPAPEPEVRREARQQAERQEDAPVISLHGRRREAVDPLEDEMARLLGELTGDTNRR